MIVFNRSSSSIKYNFYTISNLHIVISLVLIISVLILINDEYHVNILRI